MSTVVQPRNGQVAMRMYADPNCTFTFETVPRTNPADSVQWDKLQGVKFRVKDVGHWLQGLIWHFKKVGVGSIDIASL